MKIVDILVEELKEYENNPRVNDNAVEPVAKSIEEFGFKVPVIIDKDNVIIAGHTRVKAAKKLGLESVPCVIADDLSEEQIKAFRIADNKTNEFAEWDFSKLEEELRELSRIDIDMSVFDFDLSFDKEVDESDEETDQQEESPEEFEEYDEEIETKHQCPKCGYEWS